MARNKAPDAIAARRREIVGQLLCRKLTRREIVEQLAVMGEQNPTTSAPWTLTTIQEDAKALERQWKASARRKVAQWKAQQLAEIEEVRREAWARGKLDIILDSIQLEAKLTGTQTPTEITGKEGAPLSWPVVVVLPENGRTLPLPGAQPRIEMQNDDDGADED